VNLRWTLVDPNFTPVPGSNCDTTSISQDTNGTDITCAVQDASLTLVQKTVKLRVDQTVPAVTGATPVRVADRAGWWNHAVDWVFAGTDATSGIAGCDTVTYSGPDSGSGDVAGNCRDNAGNSATGHAAIKYDATKPNVTGATPARPADNGGWWNHAVNWTFAGSDATSGLAGCDTVGYSGPDSATGDVAGDCRDNAGNSATGHAAVKYDATAPTVTGATPARTADNAGWWNHSVKWTFAGSDATSGLASCDAPTYSGPDSATGDVAGACRDIAGNSTTGHAAIKYDDTAPIITSITPARPADQAGWWNHSVKWTFAGSDATSGLASCDAPTYSGPDSASGDVAGACRDIAGNSATGHAPIKYDDTAPTLGAPLPSRQPDHGVWWNHPVTIAFTGSDAASGIAACDSVAYSGPDDAAAGVTGGCRDVAGNAATGNAPVKYDATAPAITSVTTSRPPDVDGWWNHPVNVVFAGSDATSGIAGCDTVTYSGPDDAARNVSGACADAAGNSKSASGTIRYDATPPAITSVTPERPPDYNGWWNHPVKIAFAGTDALAGLAYCDTIVYAGSDTPSADVTGQCADKAGNIATGSLPVNYDDKPPLVVALAPEVGSNRAVIHWTASPDTVLTEVTRSPGIGNAAASIVYSSTGETFTDPGVQNGQTYTYSIRGRDAAGNFGSDSVSVTPREPAPDPVPLVAPQASPVPTALPSRPAETRRPLEPPRLEWRRVKRATYYNVQLFRGKKKILSVWPKSTYLQLRLSWTFRGREMRLTAGSYRWYVWPGFGKRSARRYGRLVVSRSFTWSPSSSAASGSGDQRQLARLTTG
jgi:hypothetical protein